MQEEKNSHSETENKTEQEKPQLRRSNRIRRPPERDRCLVEFKKKNSDLMLAIYVEDGLLVGSDESEMVALLKELEKRLR
ncbi:hypothetical protein K0M31_001924 [Melipona bicolor]|uniref:Uncharacterized protein n=1 Tax=Melipona bicolor TaxID=60889 RepID=A0AA40GGS4_9HYME|nr:hypothetical protein K0M31_001924 [Melipona bicolor]